MVQTKAPEFAGPPDYQGWCNCNKGSAAAKPDHESRSGPGSIASVSPKRVDYAQEARGDATDEIFKGQTDG